MRKIGILTVLCVLCFSFSASAVQVTFDFTRPTHSYVDEVVMSTAMPSGSPYDTLGLTVTGWNENGQQLQVWQGTPGLGVHASGPVYDTVQVDGNGPDELLMFSFDHEVSFKEITFTSVDRLDSFNLYINDAVVLTRLIFGNNPFDLSSFGYFTDIYKVGVVNDWDAWKVSSIVVGTTPVPEPGTLVLLGSGLVGLAWYGRKRKKA